MVTLKATSLDSGAGGSRDAPLRRMWAGGHGNNKMNVNRRDPYDKSKRLKVCFNSTPEHIRAQRSNGKSETPIVLGAGENPVHFREDKGKGARWVVHRAVRSDRNR